MTTRTKREYLCVYRDSCEEVVLAVDLHDARLEAESLHDQPIRKITIIRNNPPTQGEQS